MYMYSDVHKSKNLNRVPDTSECVKLIQNSEIHYLVTLYSNIILHQHTHSFTSNLHCHCRLQQPVQNPISYNTNVLWNSPS